MMNLSDTISAFRCCTLVPPRCSECPLMEMCKWSRSRDRCKTEVKLSVNHWLTERQPRVMTVGDLYSEDMGFYERKHEECVWPVLIARGGPDDDGTVGIIRKDAFEIKADCGLINQTWRIWTAYPTDEQREAEPWN